MCTAVSFPAKHHYFGRNLDLETIYPHCITITPRNYPLHFRCGETLSRHYAMIGMASVTREYPLYFEATNEKGLSMAGLNFPGYAQYFPKTKGKVNIAPFELIPWLLAQCGDMEQLLQQMQTINLWQESFHSKLPLTPLHWMAADKDKCITIESTEQGLQVYDNPVCVLTNNPPFPFHMCNLSQYRNVTAGTPENRFSKALKLKPFSLGMGGIGLPGDLSSSSRFVRAAFYRHNCIVPDDQNMQICEFFRILHAVSQQKGLSAAGNGLYQYTQYSSCCDTDSGIYYYTTWENPHITAVDLHGEDLDTDQLIAYSTQNKLEIYFQNG